MGKSSEWFISLQEEKQYFELMSESEFEDSIHQKYGYGLQATMKLASGDTGNLDGNEYLMGTEKPNIRDLDNLFNLDEE